MSETIETTNGCIIESSFDYMEEAEGAIYISDKHGEICMWDVSEVMQCPTVIGPILNAVFTAFIYGPNALRQLTGRSCPTCSPHNPARSHCICGGNDAIH